MARKQGFTLIELLMVIAVILILIGITYGITRGVLSAQGRAQARSELAAIAQALENYKSKNGDYPWATTTNVTVSTPGKAPAAVKNASAEMFKTLVGWQAVDGTEVGGTPSYGNVAFRKSKPVIDVTAMNLSTAWPTGTTEVAPIATGNTAVYLIDPWGNPYIYLYKNPGASSTWERFGYILFSCGPDGKASSVGIDEATGEITDFSEQDVNLDNILVGE